MPTSSCPQVTNQSRDRLALFFKTAALTGMKCHEELFCKSSVTHRGDGWAEGLVPLALQWCWAPLSISISPLSTFACLIDFRLYIFWLLGKSEVFLSSRIIVLRVQSFFTKASLTFS